MASAVGLARGQWAREPVTLSVIVELVRRQRGTTTQGLFFVAASYARVLGQPCPAVADLILETSFLVDVRLSHVGWLAMGATSRHVGNFMGSSSPRPT